MWANRIQNLPPYLFAEIDRQKQELLQKGVDVIDLGVGDPDRPTPAFIIEALQRAAEDPKNHIYPSYSGMNSFREVAAQWCQRRFGVKLDSEREVITLIGSKEGIAHFPLGFINPGDLVLVPDPAYPVYSVATQFAGGRVYAMPLKKENGFLPDLEQIPKKVADEAKLLFLNYPNNPTSAVANREYFEEVVDFAKRHQIIVCHDAAYSEIYFDGERPPSFLEIPGAKEVGIEFHSLSKTFNMTGWRIGFATGHPDLIAALGKIKTNIDSGVFQAVQWAGIAALQSDGRCVEGMRGLYQKRRDVLAGELQRLGLDVYWPKASFYLWIGVPKKFDSMSFAALLLKEASIVATPGIGFGPSGEGYIRMTFTCEVDRLQEAVDRIQRLGHL
ncbi:MAG: LL-diaminopimelate aminotransferase [Deltaproteobacteria bacterium]|nr:LL-diaminopimelate aminotransferase [Deltaproteobacteria bacterium]